MGCCAQSLEYVFLSVNTCNDTTVMLVYYARAICVSSKGIREYTYIYEVNIYISHHNSGQNSLNHSENWPERKPSFLLTILNLFFNKCSWKWDYLCNKSWHLECHVSDESISFNKNIKKYGSYWRSLSKHFFPCDCFLVTGILSSYYLP